MNDIKCPICGSDTEHPINEKSISGGYLNGELECVKDDCGFRTYIDDFKAIVEIMDKLLDYAVYGLGVTKQELLDRIRKEMKDV